MNISSLGSLPASSASLPRPVSAERSSTAATPDVQTAKATNVTDQALQATTDVQPSRQELDKAVKAVNEFVGSVNNSLKFSVDEDTGQTVVKVIDNTTKEVIKQVPSKEMLEIAKALDNLKGLLVQQKA